MSGTCTGAHIEKEGRLTPWIVDLHARTSDDIENPPFNIKVDGENIDTKCR
jgi:hypothetical protein